MKSYNKLLEKMSREDDPCMDEIRLSTVSKDHQGKRVTIHSIYYKEEFLKEFDTLASAYWALIGIQSILNNLQNKKLEENEHGTK
jgi:hypothetical protein